MFFEYCDKRSILQPDALRLMILEEPELALFPTLLAPSRPLTHSEFKVALSPTDNEDESKASLLAISVEADILLAIDGQFALEQTHNSPFV